MRRTVMARVVAIAAVVVTAGLFATAARADVVAKWIYQQIVAG